MLPTGVTEELPARALGEPLVHRVNLRVGVTQRDWLMDLTSAARAQDRVGLDASTIVREAIDTLREMGGWTEIRDRILTRRDGEPHRGPPSKKSS